MPAIRRRAFLSFALAALLGCGGTPDASDGPDDRPIEGSPVGSSAAEGSATPEVATSDAVDLPSGFPDLDGRILDPTHAPTPYTAGQLRAECRPGRVNSWSMVTPQGEFVSTMRFVKADEEGVQLESLLMSADQTPAGPVEETYGAWTDLQSHASFPAARTTIEVDTVEVPAGRFECWLYTITDDSDGSPRISQFWFAKDLPGPPVRMTVMEGRESKMDMRMILLQRGRGG